MQMPFGDFQGKPMRGLPRAYLLALLKKYGAVVEESRKILGIKSGMQRYRRLQDALQELCVRTRTQHHADDNPELRRFIDEIEVLVWGRKNPAQIPVVKTRKRADNPTNL